MESRVATIEAKLEENNKTTYRIFDAVYGNGKPGLIAEVREIKLLLETQKENKNQKGVFIMWGITSLIAVGAIISSIIMHK